MLSQDSVERAVRAAGIDVPPLWFDEVGSTNDEASRLAERGAPDWTVVAAGHQTRGRGRRGRTWSDVPGTSLLASVVLRPAIEPGRLPLLSLLAAVAMIDAVGLPTLRSKWPNDLVVEDRKVGGILPQAHVRDDRVRHVVLGVGVNVSVPPGALPAELRAGATSLLAEGVRIRVETLLGRFLSAMGSALAGDRLPDDVPARYAAVCSTIGKRVTVRMSGDRGVEGRATGIADDGGLVLASHGGPCVARSGEVVAVRAIEGEPEPRSAGPAPGPARGWSY